MRYLVLFCMFLASGCAEELTPKEAEAAAEMPSITPDQQIKEEAKSIEQAAEEAVKLIEAEAKAETDRKLAEEAEQ
jgi:hypothetical protein